MRRHFCAAATAVSFALVSPPPVFAGAISDILTAPSHGSLQGLLQKYGDNGLCRSMRRRSGGNVFAVDVLDDSALPPLRGEINRIAVTYYVPVNVLLAIASLAGAEDRKSILCISEVSGRELEASVALGHDLAGAICAKIGDSAKCEAVIKEAYRIADVIDPKPKPVPEVPQVRQSADDDTKKRPRQRNVETARRWAIRTMNDTRSCLAGVENETFELDGDCGASWDYNSRLNHYLQIIEGLPPPIYP